MRLPAEQGLPGEPTRYFRAGMAVALSLWLAIPAAGQVTPAPVNPPPPLAALQPLRQDALTAAILETRRKQAEQAADLDEETKRKIAELYQQAHDALQQSLDMKTKAAQLQASAESAAARKEELLRLTEELKKREPQPPAEGTLAEVEQELTRRDRRLNELKAEQAKLEAELPARASRRREIRTRLFSMPQRLEDIKQQLAAAPSETEPPLLTLAKHSELLARRMLIEAEVPALNAELNLYDAEEATDLLRAQRDLKTQEIDFAGREQQFAERMVLQRREAAARQAVLQAQEEVINAQPLLQPFAERNKALAEAAQRQTQLLADAEAERKRAAAVLDELKRQVDLTKQKVTNVGLTDSIGSMLRKQRATLPNVRKYRSRVRERQPLIDDAHFALFEYDDERSRLANVEPIVNELLAAAPTPLDGTQEARLREAAGFVLDRQREYLDQLIRSYHAYFDSLVETSSTEQQIINLTTDFTRYIDERVLWIRSSKPLTATITLDPSDTWALSPAQWQSVGHKIVADLRAAPFLYLLFLVVMLTLLRLGPGCRREIAEISQQTRRGAFTKFAPTLRVVLLTVLIAVPWPIFLAFFGWRLALPVNGDDFARAVGYGLLVVSANFLPLELLRQICRCGGLADAHFEWPPAALAVLRRQLKTFMLLRLPLEFIRATLLGSEPLHGRDFIEQVVFLVKAVVTAWFLYKVLHPRTGVFAEFLAAHRDGWLDRLKPVWHAAAWLAPLSLGGLVFVGYYYTAQQLTWRLDMTAWLLVLLCVIRGLLLRLLLVLRRRLVLQQQRERREAQQVAEKEERGTQPIPLVEEPIGDLHAQTAQTRRLVSVVLIGAAIVGTWWTWVDVLPALSFLERWPVWETSSTVTERVESESGEGPQLRQRVVVDKVTIADLAFAVLVATITMVAARNLPGLLELALLQRLPLDNSIRYAITTLCSYAIMFVGLVIGCNTIGLRWQQIQWLATALTFGLAFGLQEMFANFVAGIIILFERPIRVGDVVTVDNITGVVSRVRIRATTITNWDRKEFVVPNKEFITGRLLNWTLSDTVNRVMINVGVAYGSDTETARNLMEQVAKDHPKVLQEPPPFAAFEGFGDSSLQFCLRAYLPSMDNRLSVIHDLHTAIHRAFQDAGIEIAFPQRDLHIRSLPADWSPSPCPPPAGPLR